MVDRVVDEPLGGAHWDPDAACATLGEAIHQELLALRALDPDELVRARLERYAHVGVFLEGGR